MSTQKNLKNWELDNNALKDRINFLMTDVEREKPYSFATRVGLPKGTFTGIWLKGRQSLHKSTADKICAATGANPAWLMTGIGEPFLQKENQQPSAAESQVREAFTRKMESMEPLTIPQLQPNEINSALLEQCFDLTDGVLDSTFNTMKADDKSDFIVKLYKTRLEEVKQEFNLNEENFMLAVFTIEVALFYTRHSMTPKSKARLIPEIYEKYHSNAAMKQATIKQLEKYRKGEQS